MRTICTYTIPAIHAICPIDRNTTDIYELRVTSDHMIEVEKLLIEVERATADPAYQEDITEELAIALHAEVTTRGEHSAVRTVCTVYPRGSE